VQCNRVTVQRLNGGEEGSMGKKKGESCRRALNARGFEAIKEKERAKVEGGAERSVNVDRGANLK